MLHTEDILFLGSKMYVYRYDLTFLKLAADAGVGNVVLEAAYIIRHHIFLGVFPTAWNGDGFQHTHQIGKRLSRPVVRGGGSEYHRVALLGKKLCQVATKTVLVGHLVALVDHYDVPMGLFEPCPEAAVVLQCVDGDDGLVVIVEGILVERYLILYLCHSHAVETHKRYGKAVPYLLLKLGKNTLQGANEYALATSATYHLGKEDPHLDGLSQSHTIGNKQSWTRQLESLKGGSHLILRHVEGSILSDGDLVGIVGIAAQGSLDE